VYEKLTADAEAQSPTGHRPPIYGLSFPPGRGRFLFWAGHCVIQRGLDILDARLARRTFLPGEGASGRLLFSATFSPLIGGWAFKRRASQKELGYQYFITGRLGVGGSNPLAPTKLLNKFSAL